jgi:hypothetical protein
MRTRTGYALAVAICLAMFAGLAIAAGTPVKATNTWSGSVADVELQKLQPENSVLASAEEFAKLVKAWKVAEKPPAVDFAKELALVATTSGSRISLNASLDEQGDLKAIGLSTRDFGPGFRYVIITVPRANVKTVNGKPLPK